MPTSNKATRKRKGTSLSENEKKLLKVAADPSSSSSSTPHLPAPCLASVLDFLFYSDVRNCMLAGKAMAVEAAQLVGVLTIDKDAGMDIPAARRFPGVRRLNIYCLIEGYGSRDLFVNTSAMAKAVPLMQTFPKLKEAWLGGYDDGYFDSYAHDEMYDPADHNIAFRALIESVGAAYESRAISRDLKIVGLDYVHQIDCLESEPATSNGNRFGGGAPLCRTCYQFFKNFPVSHLVRFNLDDAGQINGTCLRTRALVCEVIKSRPSGKDYISSKEGSLALSKVMS